MKPNPNPVKFSVLLTTVFFFLKCICTPLVQVIMNRKLNEDYEMFVEFFNHFIQSLYDASRSVRVLKYAFLKVQYVTFLCSYLLKISLSAESRR